MSRPLKDVMLQTNSILLAWTTFPLMVWTLNCNPCTISKLQTRYHTTGHDTDINGPKNHVLHVTSRPHHPQVPPATQAQYRDINSSPEPGKAWSLLVFDDIRSCTRIRMLNRHNATSWVRRVCGRWCTPGVRIELAELFKLAWPSALYQLLWSISLTSSFAFCGSLGKTQLDSAALAFMTMNVLGHVFIIGLATACDTLFTQAVLANRFRFLGVITNRNGYFVSGTPCTTTLMNVSMVITILVCPTIVYGSKNKKLVGVILQRSILVLLLACLPVSAIFYNTELLLNLTGQDPQLSKGAGIYSRVYILNLWGSAFQSPIERYLQAQSLVIPALVVVFISNLINVALHYVLLIVFKFGLAGAGVALALSNWSIVFMLLFYIWRWRVYKTTWGGFTWDCLQDWGQFYGLAIPGMVMMSLEWWAFEAFLFVAGWLGETPLAAYVIADCLMTYSFMASQGVAIAVSTRVGNHLGSGKPQMAKTACRVALVMACICVLVGSLTAVAIKDIFPMVFTDKQDVKLLASRLILQCALVIIFDGIQCVLSGVIRGTGKQKFGAAVNLLAYYGVCLPLAVYLMLKTKVAVAGAFWGIALGGLLQAGIFIGRFSFLDWQKESEKAKARSGTSNYDALLTDDVETTDDDHYSLQELNRTGSTNQEDENDDQTLVHGGTNNRVADTDDEFEIVDDEDLLLKRDTMDIQTIPNTNTVVGVRLSVRQLVIRRGLVAAGCISVLIAGIVLGDYCKEHCSVNWWANGTTNRNVTLSMFDNTTISPYKRT